MEHISTQAKFDVFANPFFTISDEVFKKWDEERHDEYLIIPYDFAIISTGKTSKRNIIWAKQEDCVALSSILFRQYKWEKFYLWTQGVAYLQGVSAMCLTLTIDWGRDGKPLHLVTGRPFIYQIARYINNRVTKLNIDCFSEVIIKNLTDDSLSKSIIPQLVMKK